MDDGERRRREREFLFANEGLEGIDRVLRWIFAGIAMLGGVVAVVAFEVTR